MGLEDYVVRAAYNGVEFPCVEVSSDRANDSRAHLAWRVAGADVEHTGRGPLKIKVRAIFVNGITGAWPMDMFPGLRDRLESEFLERPLGRLTHPRYGEIDAHFDSWRETLDPAVQQGVHVDLEFTESNGSAFYTVALPESQEPAESMVQAAEAADAAVAAIVSGLEPLASKVETQLEYLQSDERDAAQAYGALAEVQSAAQAQLDAADLAGIDAHEARAQIRALLAASWAYAERYLTPKPQNRTYVVPVAMSLARIAAHVFGDPTKANLLRSANTFADELFVPAGTVISVPDDD